MQILRSNFIDYCKFGSNASGILQIIRRTQYPNQLT